MTALFNAWKTIDLSLQRSCFYLVALASALVALYVLQDWVESVDQSFPFYFTESIVFQAGWLLTVPIGLAANRVKTSFLQDDNQAKGFGTALLILAAATVHLLIYPLFVNGLSFPFFGQRFRYAQTLGYAVSRFPVVLLPLYGVWLMKKKRPPVGEARTNVARIMVGTGALRTAVLVDDILFVQTARPYVSIVTGKSKFLDRRTIRELESILESANFLRVHKSTLVKKDIIESVKSNGSGDYDLVLRSGHTLRMSRHYAPALLEHFKACV